MIKGLLIGLIPFLFLSLYAVVYTLIYSKIIQKSAVNKQTSIADKTCIEYRIEMNHEVAMNTNKDKSNKDNLETQTQEITSIGRSDVIEFNTIYISSELVEVEKRIASRTPSRIYNSEYPAIEELLSSYKKGYNLVDNPAIGFRACN